MSLVVLAFALSSLVACAAPRPPTAPLRSRLELSRAGGVELREGGPPAVVFSAPTGPVTEATEIALAFNQPLRSLELAADQPPIRVELEPTVPGRWEWVGTSAWRFHPEQPLPAATHFTVTVPAGELAPGKLLREPYRWSFDTERPRLLSSSPERGLFGVSPRTAVRLAFNLPVDPAALLPHLRLVRDGGGEPVALEVVDDPHRNPEEAVLRPTAPLDSGIGYLLELASSLPSTAGPLPMGQAQAIRFETAGPLRVVDARCSPTRGDERRCDPDGAITLVFGALPLAMPDLAAAATLVPNVALLGDYETEKSDGGEERFLYVMRGPFQPRTSYRLELRAVESTEDQETVALAEPFAHTFVFGDRTPSARLGGRGTFWPAARVLSLPVETTNVAEASARAATLTPEQVVDRLAGAASSVAFGPSRTLPLGKRNVPSRTSIPIDELVGPTARGPIVVQVRWRGVGDDPATSQTTELELQRTDLGVLSTIDSLRAHVWVTRLSDGRPVSGADVELRQLSASDGGASRGRIVARGRSDAQGIATLGIPQSVPRPGRTRSGARADAVRLVAMVRLGSDWAYQVLDTQRESYATGIAYTERGLYRPGEQVHLAGIERLRGDGRLVTPAGRSLTVTVQGPDDRELRRFDVTLSRFGSWHRAIRLPETSALGEYYVRATLGEHESRTWFTVAEYHPTDFTVAASVDRGSFVRGETLTCTGSARYLHGGPMAGAKLRVDLTRSRGSSPSLEQLRNFSTTDEYASSPPDVLERGTRVLDRAGEARARVKLDLPGMTGPEQVSCDVYASDLDARELHESASASVHPAEAYLGVRVARPVAPGERFRADVHAADLGDRPYPVKAVVELSRRVTEPGGGDAQEEVLDRCDVQTAERPVSCSFVAPDEHFSWGERVLVVRVRGTDQKGRPFGAAAALVPEKPREPVERPEVSVPVTPPPQPLGVSIAKRELAPGQSASVRITSPWTDRATVLVRAESDTIHWQKAVVLPAAGTVVDVPIADSLIPDAAIDVFAVRGTDFREEDLYVEISHASKVLKVSVQPSRGRAEPGDEIDVDVVVLDASGRPARAEVTLYAADVATLWLARYRTPNPEHIWLRGFGGGRQTRNAREDLFVPGLLLHRERPPRVRMGATSVSHEALRGDFRQTVLFAAGLITDGRGRVHRRVRLPDGLTTYRFMAVAATADDLFGSGEAEVACNKRLMVRPKLPAVVRSGDRFEVAALLTASQEPLAGVQVDLTAEGIVVEGRSRSTVDLKADVAERVVFHVRAERAGPFELKLVARSADGKARDAVVSRGDVVAPTFIESVALYGETTAPVAEALGDMSAIRTDVGELTFTLARTRLAGLERDMGELIEYPYGCTEQTASRLLPLASLGGLSSEVGMRVPADAAERIADSIERLRSHQRRDGGFGYWPGSQSSDPWLSAYTTWVLLEVRRNGTRVPHELMDRADGYLRALLARTLPADDPSCAGVGDEQLATAAFVVDVLAASTSPPRDAMSRLVAVHDRLPPFAEALLLHALVSSSHAAGDQSVLLERLAGAIQLDGDAAHVGLPGLARTGWLSAVLASETRSTALVLRALLALDPNHPMAPKLVTGLLADLRARTATTHERAWALVALDAYRRAHPSAPAALEARVFLGQELVGEVALDRGDRGTSSFVVAAADVARAGQGARLTFDVAGGELHYQARLRYARRELPKSPQQAGMQIFKRLHRVEPFSREVMAEGSAALELFAGDLVRVDLQVVVTAPRRVVAVEDPVAGGLVPIDPTLRSGLAEGQGQLWNHRELRDDRVVFFVDSLPAGIHTFRYWARAQTPGHFVTPPAQAFEMYAPEVRGATAAATITVRAR